MDDLKAQTIFGHLIEDEEFKEYMTDKPPTATPSNHRCLLLTTKCFDDDISFMEQVLAERRAEEDRLLAARGAIVNGGGRVKEAGVGDQVKRGGCGQLGGKNVRSKHKRASLQERSARGTRVNWS